MRRKSAFIAALAAGITVSSLTSGDAHAQTQPTNDWGYAPFRPAEFIATGILGTTAITLYFVMKPVHEARSTGGILFDDAVRDALRVRSPKALQSVRLASDITGVSAILMAAGVDSVFVPLVRHKNDTAEQLLFIDAETYAVTSLVTTTTYNLVGRGRPSYEECKADPSVDPLCNVGSTTSFWSGHTAEAFTSAGLSCAHHAYAHIYGSPAADVAGCIGMITLASATGTLRILGDRHYATDVLTGAIMGFGIGYGLPTLLHYSAPRPAAAVVTGGVTPMPGGLGLQFGGMF